MRVPLALFVALFAALAVSLPLGLPAHAQEGEPDTAPETAPDAASGTAPGVAPGAPAIVRPAEPAAFEPQLVRLVEILGSLEVLRGLCGSETGQWRARAEAIIAAEGEDEPLRRRLVAAYNRGNRALAAYRACTPSAVFAIDRYMVEGERLTRDVLVRYGE